MHSPNSVATTNTAILAYVPALHAGYVSFFARHKDSALFIFGKTIINAYPRLNRDIRALDPHAAAAALKALKLVESVTVLELSDLPLLKGFETFVLPDEDVSRDFVQQHLEGKSVELENIFLRWDGVFSNSENEVPPDRIVSTDDLDREFMRKAIREGERSADWWRQIGGLLVKNGKILALGHIRYFPSDLALDIFGTPRTTVDFGERPDLYISMHAEADLIAQSAKAGISLVGASLYTSTFPCSTCAFLIARSGISRVYYAQGYSKLDADGVLRGAGVELVLVQGV